MEIDPSDSQSPAPSPVQPEHRPPPAVVELSEVECRVVGALIEKGFTTPDVYPMTTNALVSACNQKTNRDPVVAYDAVTVDGALLELRQRNIVRRVHTQGSRSTKHRQTLDEVLGLDPGELALVSVLLLRGEQTIGELRLRTERQIGFDSIEAVQTKLDALSDRSTPLVRQLARQPGQKEARWKHLIGDTTAADAVAPTPSVTGPSVESTGSAGDTPATSPPTPRPSPVASPPSVDPAGAGTAGVDTASADGDMVARVAALEAEIETLREQLHGLADQLGESLS